MYASKAAGRNHDDRLGHPDTAPERPHKRPSASDVVRLTLETSSLAQADTSFPGPVSSAGASVSTTPGTNDPGLALAAGVPPRLAMPDSATVTSRTRELHGPRGGVGP